LNKSFLTLALIFLTLNVFSQDDTAVIDSLIPYDAIIQSEEDGKRMKYSGTTNFTFNQAYFENWISGGESSLSGLLAVDYNLNYSDRKGLVWDTNLMVSVGTTYLSSNSFFRKADDRFEVNSLVGSQINQYWNYSAYINFKTQLLPGYRYFEEDGEDKKEKISRIFSPTVVQIGLGWYFKKSDDIWVNLSPLASRGIFVGKAYTENLAPGQKYFGVERGKTNNVSIGASLTGHYKAEIMDNITVDNKFNFYVNYLEKIQNIDFEWNAKFILKVNERISSNLILHIQYDDDLINKLQIRELFGLGLSIDL
jgi:hypothetical protein